MTDEEGGVDPSVQTYLELRWAKAEAAFHDRGERTLSGGDLDDEVAHLLSTKKTMTFAKALEWIIHHYRTDREPVRSVEGVVSKVIAKDGRESLLTTTIEGPLEIVGVPKGVEPNHRYVFRDLERRKSRENPSDVWLHYGNATYPTEKGASFVDSSFEEVEAPSVTPPVEVLVDSPIRAAILAKIREVGWLDADGARAIEEVHGMGPKGSYAELRALLHEKVLVRRQGKCYLPGSEGPK